MTYMGRLCLKGFLFQDRPFHFFFSPLEKKCLEIRKFAKFESDLLKTNKDTATQSGQNLRTFVWLGLVLHHTNVCKISNFAERITFKLGKLTNFKALFQSMCLYSQGGHIFPRDWKKPLFYHPRLRSEKLGCEARQVKQSYF